MVIVVTWLQFDVVATGHVAKSFNVTVNARRTKRQDIDQILASLCGDVEPILSTPFKIARHARSQQERPLSPLGDLHKHHTHHADKLCNVIAQLPLPPRWQTRYMSGEVKLKPIEVVVFLQFTENAKLQLSDPRHS